MRFIPLKTKIILIFMALMCSLMIFADNDHFYYYYCFNRNSMTNVAMGFPFGICEIIQSKLWIKVEGQGHLPTFIANVPLENKTATDVIYNDSQGNEYFPDRDFKLVFQWDQVDYEDIEAEDEVRGDILKEYYEDPAITILHDVDIYCFTPNYTAYCIEMDNSSNVKMEISDNNLNYVPCTFTDNIETTIGSGNNHKRYYKTDWIRNHKYYIKVYGHDEINDYYSSVHDYSFTIRSVKPIVLVHGINSHPIDSNDNKTAFECIKKHLPRADDLDPILPLDFPWNDSVGEYTDYCLNDNYSLSTFINNNCQYLDKKPIVISHSIGGMLIMRQIINNDNILGKIDKFIFYGTPFCGSDKASWWLTKNIHITSNDNLNHLKRGSKHIWNLLSNIPSSFINDKQSTYFYGSSGLMFFVIYGGIDSDSVVSISSANLPATLGLSSLAISIDKNHTDMKKLSFPCEEEDLVVYNILKEYINESPDNNTVNNIFDPLLRFFGEYNSAIELQMIDYHDFDFYEIEYRDSNSGTEDWTTLRIVEGDIENNLNYYHSGILNYDSQPILIRLKSDHLDKVSDIHSVNINAGKTTFFKMKIINGIAGDDVISHSLSNDSSLPFYNIQFRLKNLPRPWIKFKLLSPPRHHRESRHLNVRWECVDNSRSGEDYSIWLVVGSQNNNVIDRINVTNLTSYNLSFSDYNMPQGEYWWKLVAENNTDDLVESEKRPFHVVNQDYFDDSDGDGYDDYEEYIRHSNPYDANDIPLIIVSGEICPLAYLDQQYFYKIETSFRNNISWSYRGKLPEGIKLSHNGILSGMSKELGTFNFTILVCGPGLKEDQINMTLETLIPPNSEVTTGTGYFKSEGEEE